jgi:outer membrane receptor for monomeric catechols
MIGHYFEIDEQTGLPALHYGNPHSGMARGVEFFVNGKVTSSVSIWAAYAYTKTELETFFFHWEKMQIEKQTQPRSRSAA